MHRLTIPGAAAVLAGTILVGGTLVSVALAATVQSDMPPGAAAYEGFADDDLDTAYATATRAAAAALGMPAEQLGTRLAAGESLKQVADAQEVGYGTVARAIGDAMRAHRDSKLAAAVMAWTDAGGQPDANLLPSNRQE